MENKKNNNNSLYILPKYEVYFDDEIASKYKPIVFSHECLSGDPEGLYYRIVANDEENEICIQYFFYWNHQWCMMASHKYDYEPIFIYMSRDNTSLPKLIVNGGLGGVKCGFHKNEIRPKTGVRSDKVVF